MGGDTDGWLYATDYIGDATGTPALEIFGMAVKKEGDTITVALNANMEPKNGHPYPHAEGGNVNFTDWVIDFGGAKYAVHFADNDNKDKLDGKGLYKDITLKDVTKDNAGWSTFSSYHNRKPDADLGDMLIEGNEKFYFFNSWETSRSIPQEIQTGTKVADITDLNESDLVEMGLDKAKLTRENGNLGVHTFGFSFPAQDDMAGKFVSYVFSECINDGVAMVNNLPACPSQVADGGLTTGAEAVKEASGEPEVTQEEVQESMGSVGDNADNDEARNNSVREAREITNQRLRNAGLTMDKFDIDALNDTIEELETQNREMNGLQALLDGLKKAKEIKRPRNERKLSELRNAAASCKTLLSADGIDNIVLDELSDDEFVQLDAIKGSCEVLQNASLEEAQYLVDNELPDVSGLEKRCQSLKDGKRDNISQDASDASRGDHDKVKKRKKDRDEERKDNRESRDDKRKDLGERVKNEREKHVKERNNGHVQGNHPNQGQGNSGNNNRPGNNGNNNRPNRP